MRSIIPHIRPAALLAALLLLFSAPPALAAAPDTPDDNRDREATEVETVTEVIIDTIAPAPHPVADPFIDNGSLGHFTWGVDIGSGIDLTAHDMTMTGISGCFGYKGGIMRFAGIGAEIVTMMNNSSHSYPIYAMARTSFSRYHKNCFLEVKAGVTIDYLLNYAKQTNFYGAVGVGFTLAHSRRFSSHAVLSARFSPLASATGPEGERGLGYTLAYASISLGCAF